MSSSVDALYEQFSIITDKNEKEDDKKAAYLKIIDGTSGSENEKKLACQFICRFFSQFSDERDKALDAVKSLLDDSCSSIRKQAIHDLPQLVKHYPEKLMPVARRLVGMLSTEDSVELTLIHKALMLLIDQNMEGCLDVLFSTIDQSNDSMTRRKVICFLLTKMLTLDKSKLTPEMESLLVKRTKESLSVTDPECFIGLVQFIQKFPSAQSLMARQEIIALIVDRARLNEPLNVKDTDRLVFLLSCIQHSLPMFSKNAHSTAFVEFLIEQLCAQVVETQWSAEEKLQMFRFLAELMVNCGKLEDIQKKQDIIYELLLYYLPAPPEDPNETVDPNFELSALECILFTFHSLCKTNPDYLAAEERKEEFKKLRVRLQYLGQALQHYLRQLKQVSLSAGEKEEKARTDSILVCTNLNSMLKDFFHNPPMMRNQVTLSWKLSGGTSAAPLKRASRFEEASPSKRPASRPDRTIYQPSARVVQRQPRRPLQSEHRQRFS